MGASKFCNCASQTTSFGAAIGAGAASAPALKGGSGAVAARTAAGKISSKAGNWSKRMIGKSPKTAECFAGEPGNLTGGRTGGKCILRGRLRNIPLYIGGCCIAPCTHHARHQAHL